MPEPRKPENWPEEIRGIAQKLTSIVAGTDRGIYDVAEDADESEELRAISVEQWSDRDFVEYFVDECANHGIPYTKNYSRDTHQVKQIHRAMKQTGHEDRLILKRFLDWAFTNSDVVIKSQKFFTLGTLPAVLNMFLQTLKFNPDEVKEEIVEAEGPPRWGGNLAEMMLYTYREEKTAGLLIKYGIPLTAAFLMKGQFSLERITKGIADRLTKLVVNGRQDDCRTVAKQSIANSPYPGGFPLKNWRDDFHEIWKASNCKAETWWREEDNWGKPYIDYEFFIQTPSC